MPARAVHGEFRRAGEGGAVRSRGAGDERPLAAPVSSGRCRPGAGEEGKPLSRRSAGPPKRRVPDPPRPSPKPRSSTRGSGSPGTRATPHPGAGRRGRSRWPSAMGLQAPATVPLRGRPGRPAVRSGGSSPRASPPPGRRRSLRPATSRRGAEAPSRARVQRAISSGKRAGEASIASYRRSVPRGRSEPVGFADRSGIAAVSDRSRHE